MKNKNVVTTQTNQVQTVGKPDKNSVVKNYKNVSIKQSIGIIIFCLFTALILLVPFTFGNAGIHYSYESLLGFFNGNQVVPVAVSDGLIALFGSSIGGIILPLLNYYPIIFFGIILFDILAALITIIFRSEIMRLIFKILSIIFGFVMIALASCALLHVAGIAGQFIMGIQPMDALMPILEQSGVLFAIAVLVFAILLSPKQFRWFYKIW